LDVVAGVVWRITVEVKIRRMYGIWRPRAGWVKVQKVSGEQDAFATDDYFVALRYAVWLGDMSRPEPIDTSLMAAEKELLNAEANHFPFIIGKLYWSASRQLVKTLKGAIRWLISKNSKSK
jgi:hypothetical protein